MTQGEKITHPIVNSKAVTSFNAKHLLPIYITQFSFIVTLVLPPPHFPLTKTWKLPHKMSWSCFPLPYLSRPYSFFLAVSRRIHALFSEKRESQIRKRRAKEGQVIVPHAGFSSCNNGATASSGPRINDNDNWPKSLWMKCACYHLVPLLPANLLSDDSKTSCESIFREASHHERTNKRKDQQSTSIHCNSKHLHHQHLLPHRHQNLVAFAMHSWSARLESEKCFFSFFSSPRQPHSVWNRRLTLNATKLPSWYDWDWIAKKCPIVNCPVQDLVGEQIPPSS